MTQPVLPDDIFSLLRSYEQRMERLEAAIAQRDNYLRDTADFVRPNTTDFVRVLADSWVRNGGNLLPSVPKLKIYGPYLPMFSITSIASGSFADIAFTHNLNIPDAYYVPIGTYAGGGASDRLQPPSQTSRTENAITMRFANSWSGAIGPCSWDGILVAAIS